MRFIHLSDLHIGKRGNEFSMLEEQKYILIEILNIVKEQKADAVLIAGDVYDKPTPGEDAVKLFDYFLTRLAQNRIATYIISGNHDSAVKLSFASELIKESNIYIAPAYDGNAQCFTLGEKDAPINLYLLPFIKPIVMRHLFPERAEEIKDYTDACRLAIEMMQVDEHACNVLVAHQFVTGAWRSESEEISVGGIDNIDASVFEPFDYVALGHIHGPQQVGRASIRYCGTPLKYSFSEVNHKKSVTLVEIIPGKEPKIDEILLSPKHDMREIKGTFEQLMMKENYEGTSTQDYIHAILTDEDEVPNALAKLRVIYPNIMKLTYDNNRTRENKIMKDTVDVEHKSELELFEEFFAMQNNIPMSDKQRELARELIEKLGKEV
ncbi:exonuclease SbcCD subunit D [Eubacterium oxidoreducens]|uniref:Nuclease SbcCD subunit D n=1 Tax=Eubacterium oxidoreducens TaxID=1732 RepID=A0A1G6BKF6_EUBOX|nr:exonuclease SbcCD subunit D [Eubacterium oxidoreducens]SDB21130.1 Exodeoxyribonuclease I subunit D [Eubacterium oxidoreducens]